MKMISFSLLFSAFFSFKVIDKSSCPLQPVARLDSIPYILGNFEDDYGIYYNITDSLWTQQPGIKYHIVHWNKNERWLIAENDNKNPGEAGLYTRIEYMQFENMQPYLWGLCYTLYNAKNDSIATHTAAADRSNARKGCNGFPFSRMKKNE